MASGKISKDDIEDWLINHTNYSRLTQFSKPTGGQAACGLKYCDVDARTGAQGYCYRIKRMKKIWRK